MKGKVFSVPFILSVLAVILQYKVISANICASRPIVLPSTNRSIDDGFQESISSPNYPNNYPDATIKIWKIVAPVGHVIDLYFISFALESSSSPSCQYDYVKIRNKCDETVPMATYCGRKPRALRSTSNVLWVEFRSDASNNNKGFQAIYMIKSNSSHPLSCPRPSDNIADIDYCLVGDQVQCCNDKDDSNCKVNKILSAESGVTITSPGWPDNYDEGKTFLWRISAPEGYVVQINFTTLVTEQTTAKCYDANLAKCTCDFVQVLDGPCKYDVGPQWCGDWTSHYKYPSFTTTGRHMVVLFKSDYFKNVGGFAAHFRKALSCSGDKPISCVTNGNNSCCPRDASVCVSGASTRSHCPRDGDPTNYTGCCTVNGSPSCCPVNNSLSCPRPSDNQTSIDVCYSGDQPTCCSKNFTACRYNELLTAQSGTIKSPGYPSKYPHSSYFVWRITVPEGYIVQLNFTTLKLAKGSSCERCSCDYVGVRDGPCSNFIETRWCDSGSDKLPSFVSTGRHLQVLFNSDATLNNDGFVAEYKRVIAVKCSGDKPYLCMINGRPACCKTKETVPSSTNLCLPRITMVIMITMLLLV